MKNKEQAYTDYIEVIRQSWTFGRMTGDEKQRCLAYFAKEQDKLKGDYYQRHDTLSLMYGAFLSALDYQPIGWREPKTGEPASLF